MWQAVCLVGSLCRDAERSRYQVQAREKNEEEIRSWGARRPRNNRCDTTSGQSRVIGVGKHADSRPAGAKLQQTVSGEVLPAMAQLYIIPERHLVVLLPDGKYAEPEIEYSLISRDRKSLSTSSSTVTNAPAPGTSSSGTAEDHVCMLVPLPKITIKQGLDLVEKRRARSLPRTSGHVPEKWEDHIESHARGRIPALDGTR